VSSGAMRTVAQSLRDGCISKKARAVYARVLDENFDITADNLRAASAEILRLSEAGEATERELAMALDIAERLPGPEPALEEVNDAGSS
jgi:hypothetical protein